MIVLVSVLGYMATVDIYDASLNTIQSYPHCLQSTTRLFMYLHF